MQPLLPNTKRFTIVVLLLFSTAYSAYSLRLCDTPSSSSLLRVIGGKPSSKSLYPWQAILMSYNADGFGMMCGATVIDDHWALTAAHCIMPSTVRAFLLLGLDSLSNPGRVVRISATVIHPEYNANDITGDIALVQTSSSLLSSGMERVCLVRDDSKLLAGSGIVTGFGLHNGNPTSAKLSLSDVLLQTDVPFIPLKQCSKEWLQMSNGAVVVTTKQLCAGAELHGTSPGDSGGPLLSIDQLGRPVQVGITSFGAAGLAGILDQKTYPGVYTRVSPYISWIESVTSISPSTFRFLLPVIAGYRIFA